MQRQLDFMLPGNPLTATGGYEYDRRMIQGLKALSWNVRLHQLGDSFPFPTATALRDAERRLAALPSQSLVLIDGLALGAMPAPALQHAKRLRLMALVHHPLAAETGLSNELVSQLEKSERDALQAMRAVVVTSKSTRQALVVRYEIPAERITVAEPGVDLPERDSLQSANDLKDPALPLRMLCVATVTPRKGHDILVDALAKLREYSWILTCVGSVDRSLLTVDALRARISSLGLDDRIIITGEIDEPALQEQLRHADLFVLASRFEGYGMAVAQALAYGLPVIGTRTGAIAELVSPQAGLLVEPGNETALYQALLRVLRDPELRGRLRCGVLEARTALQSWSAASRQLSDALTAVTATDPSHA